MLIALLVAAQTYGPQHLPPVADAEDPLVDAAPIVPGLIVQLAYATADNVAGRALLPPDARCLLRRSVAGRLARAARALRRQGLRLIARDCSRSARMQQALWKAYPHAGSVADPARGSLHQRGVAVDLGLADLEGAPVAVPTRFDEFGPAAAADAPLPDGPAKSHRDALEAAMYAAGFRVNPKEWWHYSRLYGWRWPLARID
ncbi:MAG: M15 family metallopeptidase [Myxococcales bacterium]|nr:D-alanyl-D-alanine dipeptidase [Myxococcales bacterium]